MVKADKKGQSGGRDKKKKEDEEKGQSVDDGVMYGVSLVLTPFSFTYCEIPIIKGKI